MHEDLTVISFRFVTLSTTKDYRKKRPARLWHDVTELVNEMSKTGCNHYIMSIMNDYKLKKETFLKIHFKKKETVRFDTELDLICIWKK